MQENIAIIPVRYSYENVPELSTECFRGLPFFVWSILYARVEGVHPVVVTESKMVEHVAAKFGADVVFQDMVEFNIQEVAEKYVLNDVKRLVFMDPLCPFHLKGQLAMQLKLLPADRKVCRHTAVLHAAATAPVADGNMILCTAPYFAEYGYSRILENSKPITNPYTYTLSITTSHDFHFLEEMATTHRELLPHPIRTIAMVYNVRIIRRNYSKFIDSCDLVARAGKCDNIEEGYAGARTDITFTTENYQIVYGLNHEYDRHVDYINDGALVISTTSPDPNRKTWPCAYRWKTHGRMVTQDWGLWVLSQAFPEAVIYVLGELGTCSHRHNNTAHWHAAGRALALNLYDELRSQKRLVNITEEDCESLAGAFSELPEKVADDIEYVKIRGGQAKGKDRESWYIYKTKGTAISPEWGEGKKLARWCSIVQFIPRKLLVTTNGACEDARKMTYLFNDEVGTYDYNDELSQQDIKVYTHVFSIGENEVAELIVRSLYNDYQVRSMLGPFDDGRLRGLRKVTDLILTRGKDTMNPDDLDLWTAWTSCLGWHNKKTGQFMKDQSIGWLGIDRWKSLRMVTAQTAYMARWKYMTDALDNKENHVLLVYAGFSKESGPYDPDEARECLRKLQATFQAQVSLVYLNPASPVSKVENKPVIERNLFCSPHLIPSTSEDKEKMAQLCLDRIAPFVSNLIIRDCREGEEIPIMHVDSVLFVGQIGVEEQCVRKLFPFNGMGISPFSEHYITGGIEMVADALCKYAKEPEWQPAFTAEALREETIMYPYEPNLQVCWTAVGDKEIRSKIAFDTYATTLSSRLTKSYNNAISRLNDPSASVLLLYIGFGKAIPLGKTTILPMEKSKGFSVEAAKRALEKLNNTFNAEVKLLYYDYEAGCKRPQIVYTDKQIIACRHPFDWNYVFYEAEVEKVCTEICNYTNRGLARIDAQSAVTQNDIIVIEVHHARWKDKLHINELGKFGWRETDPLKNSFRITRYFPGKYLAVHWDSWHTDERFVKGPDNIWKPATFTL